MSHTLQSVAMMLGCGRRLIIFEQLRNEETACARFIGALYFEARAESRMGLEADAASAQTESRPKPARLGESCWHSSVSIYNRRLR
jgi:hypothetical protein